MTQSASALGQPQQQLADVRTRIATACIRAGRSPDEITLLGAAKTVRAERLAGYVQLGLGDVGENYVQEGIAKAEALGATGLRPRWHLIGALQRNKAVEAVGCFEVIHSVDRASLAQAIAAAAERLGRQQRVLLQVNLAGEAGKAGCAPADLPELLQQCLTLPNLLVTGLMCLPPYDDDPEQRRPYFRQLRGLLAQCREATGSENLRHLSMGMSHDLEVAIEEGATIVRVGTALFGAREEISHSEANLH